MIDMPPWERIEVVTHNFTFLQDGHLILADGRRIVVPADPRCIIGPGIREDSDARARWRKMAWLVSNGCKPRVRIRDGRMVAVGHPHAFSHPTDIAILSALGLDVQRALEASRNAMQWAAPEMQIVHDGDWRSAFHITMRSRFTANIKIDATTRYDAGILVLEDRSIPESAMIALITRPLPDLVSIPALENIDLPIMHLQQQPSPFTGNSSLQVTLADDDGWVDFLK